MEKIFKAIGDFSRVRIIGLLMQKRLCVTELSNILNMSISSVSRHLSRLNLLRIIDDKHEAQWVYYSISPEFAEENNLLLDYIKLIAKKDKTMMDDIIRMQRYETSEFSCKDLSSCKEKVMKVMDGADE